MTVRFGLLGAGRIGKVHAKAVTGDPKAKLVAVADAFPAAAQAIADQYGCDVRSIDAICASADIDAVVICTPTDTHADLIEQFVTAGKAVFCEKPIDLSLARVRSCVDAVHQAGVACMIGFQRRFVRRHEHPCVAGGDDPALEVQQLARFASVYPTHRPTAGRRILPPFVRVHIDIVDHAPQCCEACVQHVLRHGR